MCIDVLGLPGEELEVKVLEARGNKIDFSIKEKTDYSKINEAAMANLPPPTSIFEDALRKAGVVVTGLTDDVEPAKVRAETGDDNRSLLERRAGRNVGQNA